MPDLFICHATEDKSAVAARLARSLKAAGLSVWYDEYSLKLGDSLRQAIDKGLAESKYGLVILSPSFFKKAWPQAELDGLFAKEIGAEKVILPVWHKVERSDVLAYSPILADRFAARTSEGIDRVVAQVLDVVRPGSSHLTSSGKTLHVSPSSIRLHSGEWAVKTPVTITNLSDKPAYSVQLKISLEPPDLDPRSVHIELGQPTTRIDEPVSWASVSPDAILLFLEDAGGGGILSLILHTIPANTTREVQIAGVASVQSSAEVRLWDFKLKPPEVLRKGGSVAFPFSVPQNVTMKGMGLLIRRRA